MLRLLRDSIEKYKWFTPLSIAIVYSYLLYRLNPPLLFLDTTIAGGDTGSHNYIVYYLREQFPSIHGWSHDWYGGFPFLYFYPPLLYILTVTFSYIIPLNVAFKLMTLLGTMLLPASAYYSLKLLRVQQPIPTMGAIFSLNFIFLEAYSIYGGNLPSTLSGEFSYSLSFSLFWIFIALMKRGMEENRYASLNIAILSLMVLSHPIPVIASILTIPFLSCERFSSIRTVTEKSRMSLKPALPVSVSGYNLRCRILYISKVYCLAFIITAFWSLPFLWYMEWQSIMKWERFVRLSDVFPSAILPLQILASFGIIYTVLKKDRKVNCLIFTMSINLVPYLLLDDSRIWNTRFLPFFTMGSVLLTGYLVGTILTLIFKRKRSYLILPILALATIAWIDKTLTYTPQWIKWNYEGFERKESWKEIMPLFRYLKGLPYGRVMWEYRPEYERYGTPRILENIPLFAKQPTVEGLLIESALSSPFHFINQAETTRTPTMAVAGIRYPEFDMERAIGHMRLFGIRYFIAYTEDVKGAADKLLPRLATIGGFTVYEIPEVSLILPLKDFTIERKTKDWMQRSIDWYREGNLSRPIIFMPPSTTIPSLQQERGKGRSKEIKHRLTSFKRDYIEFYTTGIGIPHMVKVSYFPRWRVEGGKGPYLVSPAFMVVVPESNCVRLYFR